MIRWHMPLQVEALEQRFLRHRPLAHHRFTLRPLAKTESDHQRHFKPDFFNGIGALAASPLSACTSGARMSEIGWEADCPRSASWGGTAAVPRWLREDSQLPLADIAGGMHLANMIENEVHRDEWLTKVTEHKLASVSGNLR
jgi:hypothetical protein